MKVVLVEKIKELDFYRITKKEWKKTLVVEEKDFGSFDIFGMAFYYEEIRNYWIIRTTNEEVIDECKRKGACIWRTKTSKSFIVEVKDPSENLARIVSVLSNNRTDTVAMRVSLEINMLNQSKGTYVEKDITIERAIRHAVAIIRNPDIFLAIQEEQEESRKAWLERTIKEEQEEQGEQVDNILNAIKKKLMQIIDTI